MIKRTGENPSTFDPSASRWEKKSGLGKRGILSVIIPPPVSPEIRSVAVNVPSGELEVKQQKPNIDDQNRFGPSVSMTLELPAWTRSGAERKAERFNNAARIELTDKGVSISQPIGQLRHPAIEAVAS